jgi:hypothetical protein
MHLSKDEMIMLIDLIKSKLFDSMRQLKLDKGFAPKSTRIAEHKKKIHELWKLKNKLEIELPYKQIENDNQRI